jgi:hypothetical protein
MKFETQATLIEVVLEELGRQKAVLLLERLKKEIKDDKEVLQEIGNLHVLAKFAFPSIGGSDDKR